MKVVLIIFLGPLMVYANRGQAADRYIVKFREGVDLRSSLLRSDVTIEEKLSEDLSIYTVRYPLVLRHEAREYLLEEIRQNPAVEYAQLDHVVALRGFAPNDPDFERLWSFQDLSDVNAGTSNARLAWEHYGAGGKDPSGNDIVVAVIDYGFDMEHADLEGNWFVNDGEIPNNNLDDDQNGYVDDYRGYNGAYGAGPELPQGDHGTHVAGIIGAKGNNQLGVTGINWDVKIIPVNAKSWFFKSSDVVRAYSYVLKIKSLWLDTSGRRGANVVATNSSFGINFADCDSRSYPLWNDMYNKMGEVGILSAVAVPNLFVDVDLVGDVPSGCSSPFTVSVTNTTKWGAKNEKSGYGRRTVDMAAPGTNILSTISENTYGTFTGTSMSAPHVAGGIAYLHSIIGPGIQMALKHDLSNTTLSIKKALLDSVRPHESLSKTVSGGTLDLYQAATLLRGSDEEFYVKYFDEKGISKEEYLKELQ